MPEFAALVERAVKAGERSTSLSVDASRLRALAQDLRAAWAGDRLLLRYAWCGGYKIGGEWLRLEAIGRREHQIAERLRESSTHGICPGCFDAEIGKTRRS